MKQLICEVCGGTELLKNEGNFVCQTCGAKYSLDEVRKMMLGEQATGTSNTLNESNAPTQNTNSVQIENLLNLAKSSYDSKNYSQAEEFCNQVIALDGQNYDAWKLKGEAINFQINTNNQRILEVYNCIMTAYRILDDTKKNEKKEEILNSMIVCFEGEVSFWLEQFEAQRPTDVALSRVKNAYVDAYNKLSSIYDELEYPVEERDEYLTRFDNFFVGRCNATCNSAWKSTVGYNYYRDYQGKGIDPFGRQDQRWVITNTDLYRPMKQTWDTFLSETDNMINLLMYAEEQFNDETDVKVMQAIYSNIAFFEECVIPSGSWKITQGYTSNWDQYESVGWHEEFCLNDAAKSIRRKRVSEYKEKERNAPRKIEERKREKEEAAKQERIQKYWMEHPEEMEELQANIDRVSPMIDEVKSEIDSLQAEIKKIDEEINKTELPLYSRKQNLEAEIHELRMRMNNLGLFKGKEKKELSEQITALCEQIPNHESIVAERRELEARYQPQKNALKEKIDEKKAKMEELAAELLTYSEELLKDRP